MPERLFAIDAYAHIYQFFYAIKGLTGPDGEPVNAVYGFARMIEKLRDQYRPDYLVVAFDGPGESVRRQAYEDYKANRAPMPEPLERQLPLIDQMLDALGVPRLLVAGQEADDVLATIATQANARGIDAVIVTTDKDAEQLVDEHVKVLHVHKDREVLLDPDRLKELKGIEPWQVVEMMALAGDSTDNIPGVPGVGPKTAVKLIRQFGSVERLYENLDQVASDKLRERLAQHRQDAEMARELVTLSRDLPVELDWEQCREGDAEPAEVDRFYRAVGFHSLRREAPLRPSGPAPGTGPAQAVLFEHEAEIRTLDLARKDYATVTDLPSLRQLAEELGRQERVSVDLETTSLEPRRARIVGFAFSWRADQGVYVATGGPEGARVCPLQESLDILRPVLEADRPGKLGQNLKYDIAVLKTHGVELRGLECDSMVASYVLHPSDRSHNLNALAQRHLDYRPVGIEELIGKGLLTEKLKTEGLWDLFVRLELPLVPVLAMMEWTGVRVDTDELAALSEEFAAKIAGLEEAIHRDAGEDFNVNSPAQLSAVLFEKLGLPTPRGSRRQTGWSTASDVLEDLKREHAIAGHVLEYRELNKLKPTYADALAGMVNAETGRIHASFNQTVTATGRLSSSDPNLQNIPVRTALGRRIRRAFVPGEPDTSLLGADYSQVELRIMAHCSGDPALSRAFHEDRDIHRFVAAQVNGVDEDDVTALMRQQAKAVNFGIIYGLSPYGLSRQIDVPLPEAEEFISEYFERYPKVKQFMGQAIDRARRDGCVRTLAGRKRRIEGIRGGGAARSAAERIAVNTVIQGSAADLIKRAMIEIHAGLTQVSDRSHMLLQIHDELVFECPDADLDEVRRFVTEKMTGALKLDVPLKVDTAVGKNWAETK